ncbi:alpha/beta hydrolase [Marinomonas sp. MED121]|uniref:alpha/beta hydrolase n=1 Tax=Marinomonas sp. MED121 TaxID=314277 RepID=UPI0002E196DE|nr:alpha/beta hydrolase [Marinomonas sp. MED121]
MMDHKKHVSLNHTKLSLIESHSNHPDTSCSTKIVALHGWLDNAASFKLCMDFMPDLHWFSLDCAGHGESLHRAEGSFYHLWDYVLDTVQFIEGLNAKVWLVGHSMGASVAMLVASVIPDKVHGLVMLDNLGPLTSSPSQRVSQLQHAIKKMGHERPESRGYDNQEAMIKARMNGFTKLGYNAAKALILRGSQLSADGRYRWRHDPKLTFPSPFRMDRQSVEAFMKSVSCPALTLLANQGLFANSMKDAELICNKFPNGELDWCEGGHHFHLEDDTHLAVAKKIYAFITRH